MPATKRTRRNRDGFYSSQLIGEKDKASVAADVDGKTDFYSVRKWIGVKIGEGECDQSTIPVPPPTDAYVASAQLAYVATAQLLIPPLFHIRQLHFLSNQAGQKEP